MLAEEKIERVLVITAHPDDLDFAASGTIAQFTDRGVAVSYCICTDGDAGGFDPSIPRSEIPGIRQREQRAAGEALGVSDIHFLGFSDGKLTPSIEVRREISRVIRIVRPQIVLCQSPERNYERIYASHPDHLAAGEAALCAVYPDAQNPFAHPELLAAGFEEWNVPETWIMGGAREMNHHVDIGRTFDRKLAALRAHVSQTAHMDDLEERLRGMSGMWASRLGLPEGTMVEGFQVVNTA